VFKIDLLQKGLSRCLGSFHISNCSFLQVCLGVAILCPWRNYGMNPHAVLWFSSWVCWCWSKASCSKAGHMGAGVQVWAQTIFCWNLI